MLAIVDDILIPAAPHKLKSNEFCITAEFGLFHRELIAFKSISDTLAHLFERIERSRVFNMSKTKVKIKSISGAKKRFKITGSGRIVRKSAFRRHLLTCKSPKRKRQLRGNALVSEQDHAAVMRMLGQV